MKATIASHGYSLVELLTTIVIIAIIATLGFPLYGVLKEKASYATCISNLRVMSVGFNGYLQDHDLVWPQLPADLSDNGKEAARWWTTAMRDYGIEEKNWSCPGDPSSGKSDKGTDDHFEPSYVITEFDQSPNTAFRWAQPWVIESGSFHGVKHGPNMLMPDGSVQEGIPLAER